MAIAAHPARAPACERCIGNEMYELVCVFCPAHMLKRALQRVVRQCFSNTKDPMNSMPIWHPGLCLFNPELDAQHITLLVLGSGLVDAIQTKPESDQHCLDLLRDIATLTRKHHALEEGLLEMNGCPTCLKVKELHARVSGMLAGMIEDIVQARVDRCALVQNITDWMRCHLNQSDMAVRRYLRV